MSQMGPVVLSVIFYPNNVASMHEDLLGYLLGALEPDEMRRVKQWLRENPEGQLELERLRRALRPLEEAGSPAGPEDVGGPEDAHNPEDSIESELPPNDLVSRTLANLPPMPAQSTHPVDAALNPASDVGATPGKLTPSQDGYGGSAWGPMDWVASITAALVVVAVALPAVLEGRFSARKNACQDNLRDLGVAMTQYVNRNAQSRLPSVASSGHQAFAGVYAPRLREAGLLSGSQLTHCPSVAQSDATTTVAWGRDSEGQQVRADLPERITLRMLDVAAEEMQLLNQIVLLSHNDETRMREAVRRLRWMQETAGGHYAYTLGVRDGGQFASPRYQGRSSFAVMSDAPIRGAIKSHGGRGINLLYEDGRVAFVEHQSLDRIPDHPLLNHADRVEAGVTIDDAVLAPSWRPPFIQASQR